MSSGFIATEAELALANQIFVRAGGQQSGVVTGDAAVEIFATKVGLPPDILSTIWNLADEENTGNLTRKGVSIAVRLIGWAQGGAEVTSDLVNISGPLPRIEGIPNVDIQNKDNLHRPQWPPFSQIHKDKFWNLFLACGPVNGFLAGDKARDCFLKSSLSHQDLWQIWNLADTYKRGALDIYEFALGMYLIQGSEAGHIPLIPAVVPPEIHQQIAGTMSGVSAPNYQMIASKALIEPPVVSQSSANLVNSTQKSLPLLPRTENISHAWDVTPAEKFDADQRFDILDPQKRGTVEGDVAAKYMLRFRLQPEDLAHIWDLADLNNDNHLTRDGFAVAIHLIHRKLSGRDLPYVLPSSLIPPSIRSTPVASQFLQDVPQEHLPLGVSSLSVDASQKHSPPPCPPRPLSESVEYSYLSPNILPDHDDVPPALPPKPDPYQELQQEHSALKSKTETLLTQLASQAEIQTRNDNLTQENNIILAKLQEMEQITSQLLNERNSAGKDLTRQNERLSLRIADMEHGRSHLAQLKRHLGISTQENHHLTLRIREMQDAAEALSLRTMNEVEDFRKQIEGLEQDNEHLRNRALEMERSISQSQTSNSETDIRELRILMGDITRENEALKKRLRDMEKSTTHLLLSSSDRALMEDLSRDNLRLKLQITEMEELTRQLQSSSEDSELRRMLEDVTHENEDLKGRLHEMQRTLTQNQSSPSVEDLQTELEGLKAEIHRLKVQLETTTSSHVQEDNTIPPPAYEDAEFTRV